MLHEGHIPLRPGIKQLIHDAYAAGIQLAIATTTTPENVTALLEVGLGKDWEGYFAANGCGDIVPHKKPAPDIYYWVLGQLGLSGPIASRWKIQTTACNRRLRPVSRPMSPPILIRTGMILTVLQGYSTT